MDGMGLDVAEGGDETMAGFFLEQAQQMQDVGSRVRFGNLRMQVAEVEGTKITSIRVRRVTEVSEVTR